MNITAWGERAGNDMGRCRPFLFAPGLDFHTVSNPGAGSPPHRNSRKTHLVIPIAAGVGSYQGSDIPGFGTPVSEPAEGGGKGT